MSLALLFAAACFPVLTQGNANHMARLDREWKSAKTQCELNDCKQFKPYENDNCVNRCISEACYQEIYGAQLLEDGEFDNVRSRTFTQCLRQELREKKAAALAAERRKAAEGL